jgi:hypothetical protein
MFWKIMILSFMGTTILQNSYVLKWTKIVLFNIILSAPVSLCLYQITFANTDSKMAEYRTNSRTTKFFTYIFFGRKPKAKQYFIWIAHVLKNENNWSCIEKWRWLAIKCWQLLTFATEYSGSKFYGTWPILFDSLFIKTWLMYIVMIGFALCW